MLDAIRDTGWYIVDEWVPELVYWLGALTGQQIPLWGWVVIGGLLFWVVGSFKPSGKRRFRRSSRRMQHKANAARHKQWKKEALAVFKRIQSSALTDEAIRDNLQGMSPFAFEYLITEGLKKKGARIRKLRRVTGDGGIDGMVELEGRWHLIQAKRYAAPVSQGIVNEFLSLCVNRKMPGLFVATGGFSSPAEQLAKRHARITLVDTQRLMALLR